MTAYFICLPPGTALLTSNQRPSRYGQARTVRELRTLAKSIAEDSAIPRMERVHVRGYLHYHDNRKRDPGNWYPTLKSTIDGGLVDSGIIEDDSDGFLVFDGIHRGYPNIRGNQFILEIWEDEQDGN